MHFSQYKSTFLLLLPFISSTLAQVPHPNNTDDYPTGISDFPGPSNSPTRITDSLSPSYSATRNSSYPPDPEYTPTRHIQGDAEGSPTITFTSYPPGQPTPVIESRKRLDIGEKYADPRDNPFHRPGALIYGPIRPARIAEFVAPPELNLTELERGGCGGTDGGTGAIWNRDLGLLSKRQYGETGGGDPGQLGYANAVGAVYRPDGTEQYVGFTSGMWHSANNDGEPSGGGGWRRDGCPGYSGYLAELTLGRDIVYHGPPNKPTYTYTPTGSTGSSRSTVTRTMPESTDTGSPWPPYDDYPKREGGDDLQRRYVIGRDDRQEIFNTWVYPYSTVGVIGDHYCTGTLIGPRHVLTAAHCVHTGGVDGGWIRHVNFTLYRRPGFNNAEFTPIAYPWKEAWASDGWLKNKNYNHDYALVVLDVEDTFQPWMSFGYHTGLSAGWWLNLNGFPVDKRAETMWHSYGPVIGTTNERFDHHIDIVKKQSGSGIYRYISRLNKRTIYGVQSTQWSAQVPNFPDFWNTHSVKWNRAARINKARFRLICAWMKSDLC